MHLPPLSLPLYITTLVFPFMLWGAPVTSPEVFPGEKIIFRLLAPNAEKVKLIGDDMPQIGQGLEMEMKEDGIWERVVDYPGPGAYRYFFKVDDVRTLDPKNRSISQSNTYLWSLVSVPGSAWYDVRDVPHGAISEVTYHSNSLNLQRRLHVYTPPGYESGATSYPVLYLLHGMTDGDDSWSTVGQAVSILDNLIAAGRVPPMVVVMPDGHSGPFRYGDDAREVIGRQMPEFIRDFEEDIVPMVEDRYRLKGGQSNRALAGLSMGGMQTLRIMLRNPDDFGTIGVFSSGIFELTAPNSTWEQENLSLLDDKDRRAGLKRVWFATGEEDFLLDTTRATVGVLKKHGFPVVYEETGGGHTWINWRQYLVEFLPMLFEKNP